MAKMLYHCFDEQTGQRVVLEYQVTRERFGQTDGYVYRLLPTPLGVDLCRLRPLWAADGAN